MSDKLEEGGKEGEARSLALRDLVALDGFSQSAQYWSRIAKMNGGGKGLKDIILSEHTGMGVVSALVATIVVSLMIVAPSSYSQDNLYNDPASILYFVLLSLSLLASISTITLSFEIYIQTLKVPDDKIEWWVTRFKGRPGTECVGHMNASLLLLVASIITLMYLLNGGVRFIIVLCILVPGLILVNANNLTLHARLLTGIVFPEKHQSANKVVPIVARP